MVTLEWTDITSHDEEQHWSSRLSQTYRPLHLHESRIREAVDRKPVLQVSPQRAPKGCVQLEGEGAVDDPWSASNDVLCDLDEPLHIRHAPAKFESCQELDLTQ